MKTLTKNKKNLKKISPTGSQVHVPAMMGDEDMLIKTKGGTEIRIGKGLDFDLGTAIEEVSEKDDKQIESETAAKWASRACAVFILAQLSNDFDVRAELIDWGDDLFHEALEHAALVKDNGKTVDEVQTYVDAQRVQVAKEDLARRVASIAVKHGSHLLMGKRRDNGKWTTPGGHVNPEEDMIQGAIRELLEETSLQASDKTMLPMADVNKVNDREGKPLHVQPFKVEMKKRPPTSMLDDPDGEVERWQWVDTSNGIPKEIAANMHTPMEHNVLMKALGLCKALPSEADQSADMYPQIDNLEAEILKAVGYEIEKQIYTSESNGPEYVADDANMAPEDGQVDSDNLDKIYSYQLLVEGMDWELAHTTVDPEMARDAAKEQLALDPMHYRKLDMSSNATDDTLAKGIEKDLNENEQNPWEAENPALNLDLGSGQTREDGYIGLDTYPYDHGTVVHDLALGLPFPDGAAKNIRLCNVEMEDDDQQALLSEIHRVLMPDGTFVYEGSDDIYSDPDWETNYPGLVLSDHESNVENPSVEKGRDESNTIHRQTFTRVATPDPATANDAEPRIGVAAESDLPEDALLAMDAMSYYYADASSSGRGNRIHGYPSQGALSEGASQRNQSGGETEKSLDLSEPGDGQQIRMIPPDAKRLRFYKDGEGAPVEDDSAANVAPLTPAQQDVADAFNKVNPNPAPPKKLPRGVSKIQKILSKPRIVPIFKANAAKQIVYGVVLAPNEIDAQDDFMEPDEIEAAAHRYMANSRVVGASHERPIKAHPVESFIAPQDFEVHGQYGNQPVKKGSWVLGVKVEDPEEWQKIMDGDYQGFSVGGFGLRQVV